jgi:hypothetical protein
MYSMNHAPQLSPSRVSERLNRRGRRGPGTLASRSRASMRAEPPTLPAGASAGIPPFDILMEHLNLVLLTPAHPANQVTDGDEPYDLAVGDDR